MASNPQPLEVVSSSAESQGSPAAETTKVAAVPMLSSTGKYSSVWEACKAGDLAVLKELWERDHPADVNTLDSDHASLLHWAAYRGHLSVVKWLIEEKKADRELGTDNEGQTPLHWACINGHVNVVHYLVSKEGCSLSLCDRRGYNALHHAVQHDKHHTALYCLGRGCHVDSRDLEGHTPLHWAAYMGYEEEMMFLLGQGALLSAPDNNGRTALHWAAARGHYTSTKSLLKQGADQTLKTDDGDTPSALAQKKAHMPVVSLFTRNAKWPITPAAMHRYSVAWSAGFAMIFPIILLLVAYLPLVIAVACVSGSWYFLRRQFGQAFPAIDEAPVGAWMAWFYSFFITTHLVFATHCLSADIATGGLMGIIYLLINVGLGYLYYAIYKSDPGIIKPGTFGFHELEAKLNSDENATVESIGDFCVTCMALKPIRSKHCRTCGHCIAKFDHHCVWINNDVGIGNQRKFILMLGGVLLSQVYFMVSAVLVMYSSPETPSVFPLLPFIYLLYSQQSVLCSMLFMHVLHMIWIGYLFHGQVWLVTQNMTTNETHNWARYEYLRNPDGSGMRNLFDRGVMQNIKDWLFGDDSYWFNLFPTDFWAKVRANPAILQQHRGCACADNNSKCPNKDQCEHRHDH